MRNFEKFFVYLTSMNSLIKKYGKNTFKKTINHSINNNRVVTVGQLTKFLEKIGEDEGSKEIIVVTNILSKELDKRRNKRTDAYDVNELVNTYREVVMNDRKYRNQIGRALGRVNGKEV